MKKSIRTVFVSVKDAKVFKSRTEFLKTFLEGKRFKVLDVGNLGEGEEQVPVRKLVERNGGEYVGLDVNKNLAEKLGAKNQIIGDLHERNESINDDSFDCIYAGEIIEHSWLPGKMITECNRVLKKGGYLLINTPNVFELYNLIRLFFLKKDTVGFDVNLLAYNEAKDNFAEYRGTGKLLSQPQHKIFYGPAALRQLMNMHGFSVEHFVYITKPRNFLHAFFLKLFPQGAQQIGVIARKDSLENIFDMPTQP